MSLYADGRLAGLHSKLFGQVGGDAVDGDSLLRAGIAIATGDRLVLHRLAVDRETVRATRFIHACVALAAMPGMSSGR